jgi:hypothetical protein
MVNQNVAPVSAVRFSSGKARLAATKTAILCTEIFPRLSPRLNLISQWLEPVLAVM